MGDYSRSGASAVASGYKAISGIAEDIDKTAVRPRELEAATSLAESRAEAARASLDDMATMAGLGRASAQAMKDAGTEGNTIAQLTDWRDRLGKAGKIEQMAKVQDELTNQNIKASESLTKAADAKIKENVVTAANLRSLTDYTDAIPHMQQQVESFKTIKNPTQADAQSYLRAKGLLDTLTRSQAEGMPWTSTKANYIDAVAKNLDAAGTQFSREKEQNSNAFKELQMQQAQERIDNAKFLREKDLASRREKQGESQHLKTSLAMAKMNESYDLARRRVEDQVTKLKTELPTEVPVKGTGFLGFGQTMETNPEILKKEAQLTRMEQVHNSNLKGLEASQETGKVFIPKPYDSALVEPKETKTVTQTAPARPAEVPAGSQYSPSTKTWWKDGKKVG